MDIVLRIVDVGFIITAQIGPVIWSLSLYGLYKWIDVLYAFSIAVFYFQLQSGSNSRNVSIYSAMY